MMALNLRVGELVEVRSEAEILATLDENGELENLPFMPEMLQFCGQRLTVHKVAHKLCDTMTRSGMRRMHNAVHLTGARCAGQAHGGCQTGCSLYWKEAWLKRVPADDAVGPPGPRPIGTGRATRQTLEIATRKNCGSDGEERFSCQATELLRAAPLCLPFRDLRQYLADVRTGNVGWAAVLRTFLFGLFNRFQNRSRAGAAQAVVDQGRPELGLRQGGSRAAAPRPGRSTCSRASSSGSSPRKRS